MRIKIDHVAKIEGHAGFVADIVKGNVQEARMKVHEGARLIEGILVGRKYYEAPQITARICGVCPVVHNLTSLRAIENAFRIQPSEQTINLRKLMMAGQMINSHGLHLFFFSLSDFFGLESDLDLIKRYPDLTQEAIKLRDLGNQMVLVTGGRVIHPLRTKVNGFRKLPSEQELTNLIEENQKGLPSAIHLAQVFSQLTYPSFERQSQYLSLRAKKEYAIYQGEVKFFKGKGYSEKEFPQKIQEFHKPAAVAKRAVHREKSYLVGALARLNNQAEELNPAAKKILEESKLNLPCYNHFYNILAQAIEIVHSIEEAIKLSQRILEAGIKEEKVERVVRAGQGAGIMEAPRGILCHSYEINQEGFITNCDIITPTAQNLANLEDDLKEYLPDLEKMDQEEREDKIRMLIRAYDPCITCSTH